VIILDLTVSPGVEGFSFTRLRGGTYIALTSWVDRDDQASR
jgi:hypothetical protein